MRACVYGAGPVGLFLAAQLIRNGADVSVVARGDTLRVLCRDGLDVNGPGHALRSPVRATDDPASLGEQDVVLVAVKSHQLPAIVMPMQPLLGADTVVMCVQNGLPWWYFHAHGGTQDGRRLPRLDPDGRIWDMVGPARVLGGVIFASCDRRAPGTVFIETAKPRLYVGEPSGGRSPRALALAAALTGGALMVEVPEAIRSVIWSKLQMNTCSGLLGCLADAAPRDLYGNPAIADAVRQLIAEVGAIAAAYGYPTGVEAGAMLASTRDQAHKSSIVQDLAAGRPMEIESMFGAPRGLGASAGIATPMLDLLCGLVEVRAKAVGAYPR